MQDDYILIIPLRARVKYEIERKIFKTMNYRVEEKSYERKNIKLPKTKCVKIEEK